LLLGLVVVVSEPQSISTCRGSQREIKVFNSQDLSKPIASQAIDVSPSVLVPFYDEDTGVLFLWGRVRKLLLFRFPKNRPFISYFPNYRVTIQLTSSRLMMKSPPFTSSPSLTAAGIFLVLILAEKKRNNLVCS